ncbi:MAG: hypothetical protein AB7V77_00470 [Candidatus Woesearchaeota archaeon]
MENDIYTRYNNLLIRHFKLFIENNLKLFMSDDCDSKKLLLEKLKFELDRSAVIRKDIPNKSVPFVKIYKNIYSLLFEDKIFKKSYLTLLKKEGEKTGISSMLNKSNDKLIKYENEIYDFIMKEVKEHKLDVNSFAFKNYVPAGILSKSFLGRCLVMMLLFLMSYGNIGSIYGQDKTVLNNYTQEELIEKNNLNLNKEEMKKLNQLLEKLEFGENKFQTIEGKKIFVNKFKTDEGSIKIEFGGKAESFSISDFPQLIIDSTKTIKLKPAFIDLLMYNMRNSSEKEKEIIKNKIYQKMQEEKQLNKIINSIIINK